MPFGIDDALMILSAIGSVKGLLEPQPKKPDMGEYQGLTEDQQGQYESTIKKRIGSQTESSVRKLRTGLASRGLRGGITGAGEGEIRAAGDTAISDAIAQFILAQQQDKQRFNLAKYTGDMSGYNNDMQQYYNLMGGSGKNLADVVMKWAELFGKGDGNSSANGNLEKLNNSYRYNNNPWNGTPTDFA